MECFQVRYDSRVIIYERKLFIRLAAGLLFDWLDSVVSVRRHPKTWRAIVLFCLDGAGGSQGCGMKP